MVQRHKPAKGNLSREYGSKMHKKADNPFELSALVAGEGFEPSFLRFFVTLKINTLHLGQGLLDRIFVPNLSRNKLKFW